MASLELVISLCLNISCGRAVALEMAKATLPERTRLFTEMIFLPSYLKLRFQEGGTRNSDGMAAGAEAGTVITMADSVQAEVLVFCL